MTDLYHKMYRHARPDAEWVVLVHGAGGSSAIWFKQLREYRRHFHALLIDLRGHGKSQNLFQRYARYTFDAVSREVLEVLDHCKIESAHFVGISLGTIIIRTIGEMAPHRVRSMVMGGAIVRMNFRSRVLAWLGDVCKSFLPYIWLYKLFAWTIMPYRNHRASRSLFVGEAKHLCQKEFIRWYRLVNEVNPLLKWFREQETQVPTLYVMGSEDHMFLPSVRKVASDHASSILKVIDNSGHVCNVDQPDLFNALTVAFMRDPRAAVRAS
ncbi:MAG: alpha/beta hydrolase [Catalinimonas sp.]